MDENEKIEEHFIRPLKLWENAAGFAVYIKCTEGA